MIGDMNNGMVMMTWPGEATTSLGFELKDTARRLGFPNPWFLGLTNDYMAYFTNKSEFKEGTYEACSSLYNYRGSRRIIERHTEMLHETLLGD